MNNQGFSNPKDAQRRSDNLGSIIGIGEIVLLPLDVLKIKRQTNPEAFRGRGVFRIVADEGFGLYRGAGWTAARNAPGSFAVSITPQQFFQFPPVPLANSNSSKTALRRIRSRKTISLQTRRLQHSRLAPKLRRLYRRRNRIPRRLCPSRRHQNTNPEQKLRQPGERIQDRG